MNGTLLRIIERKKLEVKALHSSGDAERYRRQAAKMPANHSFFNVLAYPEAKKPLVIAEFKRASPSMGDIRPNADPAVITAVYQASGAAAISVLTDEGFKGTMADMDVVRRAVTLPILRKDFILDDSQVHESRVHGADAILLIMAMLRPNEAQRLFSLADAHGMDVLFECHTKTEIDDATNLGAKIIGINNRDLNDFKVDNETVPRLVDAVQNGSIIVAESGIQGVADIRKLPHRVSGALVGTFLMDVRRHPQLHDIGHALTLLIRG